MMYSKTFFHCFHQKLDSIKESRVRAAHAQSYSQKTLPLTGFMLAPEVKQLADFGFLPNDRPIKTF